VAAASSVGDAVGLGVPAQPAISVAVSAAARIRRAGNVTRGSAPGAGVAPESLRPDQVVAIRRGSYLWPVASLSTRDYAAVLGIVAAASHGTVEEPLPRTVLESVRRLFPAADTVAYFEGPPWDRAHRRVWIAGDYLPWSGAERRLHDELRFQNPLLPTPATVGRAWRMTDRMSVDAYRRTDLYNLLGRRHDIEYSMDYWMRAPDGIVRGLCFDASRRDFSERDRDVLDVLGSHLATVLARQDPRLPQPADGIGLTKREAEILAWAARGHTNAEIAATLSVSAHTVRKHLENAFGRLGVHSRAAAVAVAYDSGLVGNGFRPPGRAADGAAGGDRPTAA